MKLNRKQKELLRYFKKCCRKATDPLQRSIYDHCIKLHNEICKVLLYSKFTEFIIPLETVKHTGTSYFSADNWTSDFKERELQKHNTDFEEIISKKIAFYQEVISVYNRSAWNFGYSYKVSLKRGHTHALCTTWSSSFEYSFDSELKAIISLISNSEGLDFNEVENPF